MENSIKGKCFSLSYWAQSSHIISVTITFSWPSWGYMSPRGVENARTMLWPFDCPEYRRASDVVPISETQPMSFASQCPFLSLWGALSFFNKPTLNIYYFYSLCTLQDAHILCVTENFRAIFQSSSKHHHFITFVTFKVILPFYTELHQLLFLSDKLVVNANRLALSTQPWAFDLKKCICQIKYK